MTDYGTIIERDAARVGRASFGFADLAQRRDRRQRNRRIGTIVLALVIATILVGGSLRALHRSIQRTPANRGITPDNVKDLKLAWSAQLGGSPPNIDNRSLGVKLVYQPTVADGLVIVGTDKGKLLAYDAACASTVCTPSWVADLGGAIADPLTVADGMVFASSNGGGLFVFEERCGTAGATCEPLWRADTGHAIASPVVVGGIVYGIDPVAGDLYAFRSDCGTNGETCSPLWSRPTEATRAPPHILKWVDFRPSVAGGIVFAIGKGKDDRLFAFDALSGRPLWTAMAPPPGTGSISQYDAPVISGGLVLAPLGGRVQAFTVGCRTDGGRCRPTFAYDGGPPVVVGDQILSKTFVDTQSGGMASFSLTCGTSGSTCHPTWSATDGGFGDQQGPDVGDGVFVSTSYLGTGATVHVFSTTCSQGCAALWAASVNGPRDATVSGDVVFVPTSGGDLYAFPADCRTDGGNCSPIWTAAAVGSQPSPPVVAGDRVYVATADGKLQAFALPRQNQAPVPTSSGAATLVLYLALAAGVLSLLVIRRRRSGSVSWR